jgi:type II restriction enzyme
MPQVFNKEVVKKGGSMDLQLPYEIAEHYSSSAQRVRIMTEYWVENSIFCPNCGTSLSRFENNKPVADFYCISCMEEYELKSKNGNAGNKIVDGAYSTMIERLVAENNPNFFFLSYDKPKLEISNFLTIPKYFFVPNIIEKRTALRPTARRAGWVGCNIVMKDIPEFGKIYYIENSRVIDKDDVLNKWNNTEFIKRTHNVEAKGWLIDVLLCVEKIGKDEFTLDEVYGFESYLQVKHPMNNNVKAKIRQQLQFLRDKNIIDFVERGKYCKKL